MVVQDAETGQELERRDLVKGYEFRKNQYLLLSDEDLKFQQGLKLPTFDWEGKKVLRRSMIAIQDGRIIKWWYPIFPPDRGVDDLMVWLKERQR